MMRKRTPRGYEEVPEPYTMECLCRDLPEEASRALYSIPNAPRAEFGINPTNKRLIAWVTPGRSTSYKWYEYVNGQWTEFTP